MFKNIVDSYGIFNFELEDSDLVYSASQKPEIIEYFTSFLIKEKFDTIVEFGTFTGGLAVIINEICKKNNLKIKIYTFDIEQKFKKHVDSYFQKNNISFIKNSCFSKESEDFFKYIIANKKICLLCDNGNKIEEFNKYSYLIKNNDFIMAHDYKNDLCPVECNWKWAEIKYSKIKDSIIENSLNKYEFVNFEEVAWCCYFK